MPRVRLGRKEEKRNRRVAVVGETGVGTTCSRQCMPHHLNKKNCNCKKFAFFFMYDDDLLIQVALYLYLVRVLCSVCLNLYVCYVLRTRTCATRTCAHLLGRATWTTWTTWTTVLGLLGLLCTFPLSSVTSRTPALANCTSMTPQWQQLLFPYAIEQRRKSNTRFGQLHFDDPTVGHVRR